MINNVFEEFATLCYEFNNILIENAINQQEWNEEYFMIDEKDTEHQIEVYQIMQNEEEIIFQTQEEILIQEMEDDYFLDVYMH